jgi:hypothetical protein
VASSGPGTNKSAAKKNFAKNDARPKSVKPRKARKTIGAPATIARPGIESHQIAFNRVIRTCVTNFGAKTTSAKIKHAETINIAETIVGVRTRANKMHARP